MWSAFLAEICQSQTGWRLIFTLFAKRGDNQHDVALVIFTTWKPLNAIWGSYLFGLLYWLYQFLPTLLHISVPGYVTDPARRFRPIRV